MFALVPQSASGEFMGSANRRFKAGYGHTLELTLLAAAALHVAAFLTFPPMTIEPYRMPRDAAFIGTEVPPDVVIPPAPPETPRPVIPDFSSVGEDAPLEATIPRNDGDLFDHPILFGESSKIPTIFLVHDEEPVAVVRVKPVYPDIARAAGATGRVEVEVVIDVTGRVSSARVVRSNTIPALNQAALAAARQWLFTPAKQREHPVRARIVIPFEFGLD